MPTAFPNCRNIRPFQRFCIIYICSTSWGRFKWDPWERGCVSSFHIGMFFLLNALNSLLKSSTTCIQYLRLQQISYSSWCSILILLLFWQAAGTGLHGNSDAHTAASDGHVGYARPFISVWAVTLNTGQEAVLVKASWRDTHRDTQATCLTVL